MDTTPTFEFTEEEKRELLRIARQAISAATRGEELPKINLEEYPPNLRRDAACFVTLHKNGLLRGCTGSLVATRPLVIEVAETAVQTAFRDPRFPPVRASEVPDLDIEISVLTPSRRLEYDDPEDLIRKLRPGIDGVTLRKGIYYRATFLPQVWETIPEPVRFLEMLSQKMGLHKGAWRDPDIEVETYQVVSWSESELGEGAGE